MLFKRDLPTAPHEHHPRAGEKEEMIGSRKDLGGGMADATPPIAAGSNEAPRRVQRKRSKGWRTPINTTYVGRPGVWGNPFEVSADMPPSEAVERYRSAICGGPIEDRFVFERWLARHGWVGGFDSTTPYSFLRGKNLMCWCPLDKPCHADVLLELANAPNGTLAASSGTEEPNITKRLP